jgi:uncharacterized protein (TIRG00374 family)
MTVGAEAAPVATAPAFRRRALLTRMATGLGIGAIFVLIFLQFINFRSVSRRLEHLNIAFALLCGAVFLSAYAVRALRWRLFLAPDHVTRRRVIGIYFVATWLNWLLPFQGGELAKGFMLRRSNSIPLSRSLATVTMDKAMDLLPAVVLLAVVPFAGLHLSRLLWLLLIFPLLILGAAAVVLGLAGWRRDRTLASLSRLLEVILPRRVSERVQPFVVGFVDTLLALSRKPRLLLTAAAYTAVAVGLDALFCYLAFRSVGASLSLQVVLYGYMFYNLAYILPTPPAHLGSNELIGLLVFSGIFGVSRSAVGAMFLFSHPWTGILMTCSALACVRAIGLDLREISGLWSGPASTGAT